MGVGLLVRALCNIQWRLIFSLAQVSHLEGSLPIIVLYSFNSLVVSEVHRSLLACIFSSDRASYPKYLSYVRSKWHGSFNLSSTLIEMRVALQQWSKEVFGNINWKKCCLLARFKGIQSKLSTNFHGGLTRLEAKLRKELDIVLDQEELLWFQKSREKWILEGDRNTSYYHTSVVVKGNKKIFRGIKLQDEVWRLD